MAKWQRIDWQEALNMRWLATAEPQERAELEAGSRQWRLENEPTGEWVSGLERIVWRNGERYLGEKRLLDLAPNLCRS